MVTEGPMYTPAQQAEHAEKARKDVGPAAEINTKPSTPVAEGQESPATAQKRAADAQAAEGAGLKQPAAEKSPAPKKE